MRKTLFKLHSWLAISALIPLILISLTGSILVFKTEIDGLLNPQKHFVIAPAANRLPLDNLRQKIELQFPNHIIGSWELFTTDVADRVYLIERGKETWSKFHLNQYTGEFLSAPVGLTHYITDWLVELHYTFLLNNLPPLPNELGTILGFVYALILLFLGVSGLVMYRKFWKKIFSVRWQAALKVVFSDVHKMVGVIGSPILLIVAITGGYFNATVWYHDAIEHHENPHPPLAKPMYSNSVSFTQLYRNTQQQINSFQATYLLMPLEPNSYITFFGKVDTANPFTSEYASTVSYHPETGKHIANWDIREADGTSQTVDMFRKLHFGYFAGFASKLLWCILGLSPTLLAITGCYMWLARRKRKLYVTKKK